MRILFLIACVLFWPAVQAQGTSHSDGPPVAGDLTDYAGAETGLDFFFHSVSKVFHNPYDCFQINDRANLAFIDYQVIKLNSNQYFLYHRRKAYLTGLVQWDKDEKAWTLKTFDSSVAPSKVRNYKLKSHLQ